MKTFLKTLLAWLAIAVLAWTGKLLGSLLMSVVPPVKEYTIWVGISSLFLLVVFFTVDDFLTERSRKALALGWRAASFILAFALAVSWVKIMPSFMHYTYRGPMSSNFSGPDLESLELAVALLYFATFCLFVSASSYKTYQSLKEIEV